MTITPKSTTVQGAADVTWLVGRILEGAGYLGAEILHDRCSESPQFFRTMSL